MSSAPQTSQTPTQMWLPLELPNILFLSLILICLPSCLFVFISYLSLPFPQLDLNFPESIFIAPILHPPKVPNTGLNHKRCSLPIKKKKKKGNLGQAVSNRLVSRGFLTNGLAGTEYLLCGKGVWLLFWKARQSNSPLRVGRNMFLKYWLLI